MKTVVYPGSFDPVTYGHLDIVRRSLKIFDKVIVCILENSRKVPAFSTEERKEFLKIACASMPGVEISSYSGLLVDFLKERNADAIVKGLRAVSDFESEFQMALANSKLYNHVETVFLPANVEYSYLNSSVVREIASYGGKLSDFVPEEIIDRIYAKLKNHKF